MRHAFEAGTIVAIVAGVVGYFVVLRRLSFAAHAPSHCGFAGAAGAVSPGLIRWLACWIYSRRWGLSMAALRAAAAARMCKLARYWRSCSALACCSSVCTKAMRPKRTHYYLGKFLALVLVTCDDFGDRTVTLAAVGVLYRRLLFTSLDEDVAEAKGVSVLGMNVAASTACCWHWRRRSPCKSSVCC